MVCSSMDGRGQVTWLCNVVLELHHILYQPQAPIASFGGDLTHILSGFPCVLKSEKCFTVLAWIRKVFSIAVKAWYFLC